jgi:hypothetical protein
MRARSIGSSFQPLDPTGHQHAQFVSECEHFFNPSTQRFQALANENPNANARVSRPDRGRQALVSGLRGRNPL